VTLAEQLPLMPSGGGVIELDDPGASESVTGRELFVSTATVDLDFFDVFQTPVLAGRAFVPQDTGTGASTVVVNYRFVDQILAGRNAIGRPYVTERGIRKQARNRDSGSKSSAWCAIWCQTPRFP